MLHDLVVVGDTAVVRIESPYKGGTFREILTLLRSAGRWQIAFKTFDVTCGHPGAARSRVDSRFGWG